MASSITGELDALKTGLIAATTGVISRTVNVRNRNYTGFYDGPFPLVQAWFSDYRIDRLYGGRTGTKGQDPSKPSFYSLTLEDIIDSRAVVTEAVAASQTDLLALVDAIVAYFDHLPNRTLGGLVNMAGEYLRFKGAAPFQQVDGGDIRTVIVGVISIQGIPHSGSLT